MKDYPNPLKALKALLRFVKIFRLVKSHNQKFKDGLVDFEIETNKFADLDPEDIEKFASGTQRPLFNDLLDFLVRPKAVITVNISTYPPSPTSHDWKALGHVTPVKDQGYYCNSCWAFSVSYKIKNKYNPIYLY